MEDITLEEKKQAINNIIAALSDDDMKVSSEKMGTIRDMLNKLFPNGFCKSVNISINTDKLPFGIYLNPDIDNYTFNYILFSDEAEYVYQGKLAYDVDIDSKLFELGLSPEEITELMLHDINILLSAELIDMVRKLIDVYVLTTEDQISISNSVNQKQLIIYGLKDTMYKLYSAFFDCYGMNLGDPISEELKNRISKMQYNNNSIFNNFPKIIILQWVFMIYKNMKMYSTMARDVLNDAKELTGSTLIKKEIEKTVDAISRVDASILESVGFKNFLDANNMLNEGSLFKALKINGLRTIENDYYEFAILVKSAQDENEALYALRGINTRINILTDYVWNTPNITESERKHWEQVIAMYQDLRLKLTKKNIINKKQYGLFFDYSKLDNLDQPKDEYEE